MKWNGIVSHAGQIAIAARFAAANTNHASSTDLRRNQPIATVANRFDPVRLSAQARKFGNESATRQAAGTSAFRPANRFMSLARSARVNFHSNGRAASS